ncbi:hypothetical protein V6N13_128797 [Hibiscus sabdariffa]|uniref:PGG domain-containing protein n=1 Tax=Hibiscus sabdariffa TaxID=183260 RepID=A0ABR2SJB6_9ROSI
MEIDPSSSIDSIMSSDSEPGQPVESINYMDAALYKAAARGNIEVFNNYQGFELESLRTRDHNTVLHVYLASPDVYVFPPKCFGFRDFGTPPSAFQNLHRRVFISDPVRVKRIIREMDKCTKFIQQILSKCPSLLLEANTRGQTPLHVAARYGLSTVVKFLIQFQEKAGHGDLEQQETSVRRMLRMTDLESNTALHIAVRYGHREVVQELLEFEDPDFPYFINRKQESPLYIAARRGDVPMLDMILGKLNSVDHSGPHGRTALHAAVMAGDAGDYFAHRYCLKLGKENNCLEYVLYLEATRVILEKRRSLTKETDEDGHTPLHYAAHLCRSYSVVEELLKWDKSAAYATDKKWEMTPLLMAARQGHGQVVIKILSVCPDSCEKVDKIGWNLLHFVAFRNYPAALSDFIFKYGDIISPYGSVRNLMGAEDAHGITPPQVYDASRHLKCEADENYKSNKKSEQILKLLEHMINEEVAEKPVHPISAHSNVDFEKSRDGHLVVGALIATVTFAAAISYRSDKGSEQGTPFLIHDAAFKAFVVADALAFVLSLSAVADYLGAQPPFISNPHKLAAALLRAGSRLYFAMWAVMVAFCTGTYVVLKPSPGLAITSCCIGLISFIFLVGNAKYPEAPKSKIRITGNLFLLKIFTMKQNSQVFAVL